ncbi:MAG: leucine-rich repeat domain-containing protein [Deltaproteobacteria bacterium]|nr:leucine-rich repeat domain-containing protein [Deltaproteobacteria bacterium]
MQLPAGATRAELWGHNKKVRHSDEELAVLAEAAALEALLLYKQPVTRLPALHARAPLTTMSILMCHELASLAGIEACVRLQELLLDDVPAVDAVDAFARMRELPELTTLELRGAHWTRLPAHAGELPSLRALHFRDCPALDVDSVCAAFARSTTLRSLRVEAIVDRFAIAIPPSIARLASLEELVVTGVISRVPDEVAELQRLEALELAGGTFAALPDGLGELRSLRRLKIRSKKLTALPRSLAALAALEELEVQAPLKALPSDLELPALHTLDVRATKLTSLPTALAGRAYRMLRVPDGVSARATAK